MATAETDAALTDAGEGQTVLSIQGVHVRYRVYEDRRPSMRELFAGGFRSRSFREIHAVQGVDLNVRAGESVGLIGSNGSGKSTLLRAVTGLLPIDDGQILARSRPTLLGVGAVLRPELSGRKNVEIGLLATGMPKQQVDSLVEGIVEFAGLTDFIDLPLKTYSSGMRARLHFAIATVDRPDILLIDEALAVGDRDFKDRSARRLEELTEQAGCVIVVSHGLSEIKRMCERAVWLEKGRVLADGPSSDVIAAYEASTG